ncbi:hypothetical protein [Streptomyces sp. NRRL WC-3742]|uniref:hypothetical protein n=1 Tax=Streptomyces sp. NRRL WC-3742 TaxID=1463934 RepID=UPI00131B42EF|nr:hypothetical protein [Streptomyces sp. NRRL WC-3742]
MGGRVYKQKQRRSWAGRLFNGCAIGCGSVIGGYVLLVGLLVVLRVIGSFM